MLAIVTVSLAYQEAINGLTLHLVTSEKDLLTNAALSKDIAFKVVLIVNIALNAFAFLFVLKLLSFHIYLKIKKMTTYDYILREREKKENKKKKSRIIKRVERNKI
jgi:hypothetical protein